MAKLAVRLLVALTLVTAALGADSTLTGPFTFAATGDSILLRPIEIYERDPGFAGVRSLLERATVAFTNFEFTVFDLRAFRPTPQAEHGGLHVHGAPERARDLKWLGVDVVARANNHAMDYGLEGMQETDEILDTVGLVRAGTGRSLGEARAPGYLQTAVGRVALISTASSFTPLSRAGHARSDMKGRPGISPLRWTREVTLDPNTFATLRTAVRQISPQAQPPADENRMTAFGTEYRRGDRNRVELKANERDIREIIAEVRSARRQADFVVVTIHAHEPGNQSETPADFLPAFARACIDAGADMFIGHGPHQVRGIEIYKGRPIFYSLGNFFFQYQSLEPLPADIYETHGVDPLTGTPADLFEAVKDRGLGFKDAIWWESIVAVSRFENNALAAIELHPIDLGATQAPTQRGTPRLASAELGKKILDRIGRLSEPFGTRVRIERGIGVVQIPSTTSEQK